MSQPPLPSTSSSSSSQKTAAPVARTRPDSTMPGLSSTASSIRAKAKGSRLSQPGWTPQDDDDDDGFDEGPGDTQRQLDELKTGILMPGMGARSMTAPTLQQSTSASQRVPIALKSALKKPAPLLRRATGAASSTGAAAPSAASQQARTSTQPAPSNRFKGTPPRAIRYSLPVRTEKPVRTTKVSGKHVVLPSESQLAPLPGDEEEESSDDDEDDDDESSSEGVAEADDEEPGADEEEAQRKRQAQADERKMRRDSVKMARQVESMEKVNREARKAGVVQRGPAHARAPPRVPKTSGPAYHTFERMAPNARTHTALPRLTSYAVGTDLHIPTLNGFLRREHGVRPRLYDECAYVAYFKPLLPGFGRANLRSSPEPRSGSPGAESRRERELEEREERGYMGSYFAASKDDQEESIDPEGYIQGGEGSGSGEGSGGREQKQRQRYRDGDATEAETETEGEGEHKARDASYELASSPESKEEMRYGTFSDSEEVNVNAADVGDALATPRALKPRNFDLEGVPVGLHDTLGEPVSSPMSESSGQLTPGVGEGTDGNTLSADAAGAQDMLKHQLEDEATERGLTLGEAERGEVSGDVVDDAIVMERDGANGANGEQQDQLAGGRRRRGGGRRKGRKSSGPNQASHNHDTSPNMLTSRPILEALQVAELVVLPYGVVVSAADEASINGAALLTHTLFLPSSLALAQVFYNFSASEERDIIEDILSSGSVRHPHTPDDVETEAFHFCYDPTVPAPRIFNDFFTFRAPNHLLKLSLAHAVAQSSKLSVFEESMQRTLELTSHIPKELASSGELRLKRREALRLTGRLFKLRVDVNLTSNVLDTPELFWSEATLQALYDAIREYLEIDQRVGNLNDRLKVANDLLEIIHGHVAEEAMSKITVVIIALIVVACFVAVGEITARLLRSSGGGEGRALLRAAKMGMQSTRAGQQYHVGL